MAGLDWVFIGLYFGLLLGITWWVIRRSKDTAADYFLASRNLGWFIVGASIFASNIGSEHLVGLAGAGATSGVALAHYELHAWCLLVLAWVFVPFYMRSMVFTMPEFLDRRCAGNRTDRSVHGVRRYAGRGVQRCGADICFDPGIVFAYSLRLGQARRMARTALLVRLGHVQSVEAADPSGCAGHVGACLADRFRR